MIRPKILLVDDNRLFLEMEKEFLQSCAVQIYTARTGKEALDVVRLVLPDLVFMGLNMPEMDGAACCAAIKSDSDLKSVPVIMIVTPADGEELERCRLAGCDFILKKPVNRRDFIGTGHRFLPGLDRMEIRIPCLTLVVFRIGERAFHGMSANLSTRGMFIAFGGEVELEDRVNVNFLAPGSDDVIEAVGRVAWKNTGTPLCKPSLAKGFGIEFLDLPLHSAHIIADFMDRAEDKGAKPVVEGAYVADCLF